jgi:branched-subunit amino acid aminotransferase/4-amino-4-deoxychorismate lyase
MHLSAYLSRLRKTFEKEKAPDVNEVIFPITGGVCEGASSNFFAVHKNGTVMTAPDHLVLEG